jgi:two-component SAPR family response regulator
VNKSSNWSIKLPENVLSDYAETIFLAEKIKNDNDIDRSDVQRFLELTSYGELLPNIQFEWIDNFKSEFSNIVMDTLSTLIHSPKIAWDQYDSILLQITDSMFLFDPLSEEALYLKCKILFQQDKKTLAISTYENFIKRYQINLGEEFDKTFKEIVGPLL